MDRFEMIDILYTFITERFDRWHWKSASKYNYYRTKFADYNSYNDFLLCQELTLYSKTYEELLLLMNIKDMIEQNGIKVMDSDRMFPDPSHVVLFDTDGSVIISNEKF